MLIKPETTSFDPKKKEAYDSVNQPGKIKVEESGFDSRNIFLFKTTVLRALSDETRQGIVVLLGKYKSLCVNDLAGHFKVSRPTVSHHLQVLKQARIVKSNKIGKEIFYMLNIHYLRRSVKSLSKIIDSIDDVENIQRSVDQIKEKK